MDLLQDRPWGQTILACDRRPSKSQRSGKRKAIFLDRDGTLIADKPYSADPGAIEILPGVFDGLLALWDADYLLVVVTNQSGIARGYYDSQALGAMHRRMNQLLDDVGLSVAAYYYCPHHVDGRLPHLSRACRCRKPAPGMILRAARDWSIDLPRSWMIGDRVTDAQAASAAGCQALLVGSLGASGNYRRMSDLAEAARYIIARDGRAPRHEAGALQAARRG